MFLETCKLPGVSAAQLFDYHARPGALARLTPPFEETRNAVEVDALSDGARATVDIHTPLGWRAWVAVHRDVQRPHGFVDEQERGPFKRWRHKHIFEDGRLTDRIDFDLPAGRLGEALAMPTVIRRLKRVFRFRHATTKLDFELFQSLPGASQTPQTIAITGASGLVGRELSSLLRVAGHTVIELKRSNEGEGTWDPMTGDVRIARARGIDAFVHLAGENIAAGRLDDAHRAEVRKSRIDTTAKLVASLARMSPPPRTFVSASAVGFYGDRGNDRLDDSAGALALRGSGFLADLCADWEEAALRGEAHGMRVVTPRIGLVLSPQGGALAKMLPAFRKGLGAVLGDGSAWMPFLSVDEAGAILYRALFDERVRGPFNAVGLDPLTNRAFTKQLAAALERPAFLRVPRLAARALFGDVADEAVFISQRVVPGLLQSWGHTFRHETTNRALRHVLGSRTRV